MFSPRIAQAGAPSRSARMLAAIAQAVTTTNVGSSRCLWRKAGRFGLWELSAWGLSADFTDGARVCWVINFPPSRTAGLLARVHINYGNTVMFVDFIAPSIPRRKGIRL